MTAPDVSDPGPPGSSSTDAPKAKGLADMTDEEARQWIEMQAKKKQNRYAGLERALRQQLIQEGVLPPSALWEDTAEDPSSTVQLCTDEEFERKFTEASLGLALNVGNHGTILVKRCVPGSPSASRRIPPGVVLTHVGDAKLEHLSLKDVQTMLQQAERPVSLRFRQTDASMAIASASVRAVAQEREEHERRLTEARLRFEEEMRPVEPETALVFSRTYSEARLGLCLVDDSDEAAGTRRTRVRKCLPRTPSWKSGLPENVCITAINGKSVEYRRLKEVKKLIELAQRPVTIAFSMEEEVSFPAARSRPQQAEDVPAYVLRPV